ncbi:MAG: TonB-dependent receptor [Sterolibacterium sp.]|nr:TonB-dependent receptor [Sterolibacterium sp.]MBP9798995.1 TonB-dependent receptor [Sterolibacterium sp.]
MRRGRNFSFGRLRRATVLTALAGVFLMAAQAAWALEEDEGIFDDLPVVLSASRLHQSTLESPAAVTVIDHSTLVAAGVRRLEDALRLVPGFYVGYLNGGGTAVAYHGLSDFYARRMQVLVDGVSIYTPLLGGVDWALLPLTLEDVERIEVVRGANAVTFGANAFLATINIITRDPATETGSQVLGALGSGGIRDLAVRTVHQGERFRYSVSLAQQYDDGLDGLADWARINKFNLRAQQRLDERDELMFQLRASGGQRQTGGVVSRGFYQINIGPGQFDPVRQRVDGQEVMQLRWTRAYSTDDEFWLQYYHAQQRMREPADVMLPLPGGASMPYHYLLDFDQTRDDVEGQRTQRLTDRVRLAWGGQWRLDRARSAAMLNSADWRNNTLGRVFANLEVRPQEALTLQGGMMLEHNSISGNAVSPRLAGTYAFSREQSLRLGISRANRTPTINESFGSLIYHPPAALQWLTQGRPLAILALSSGGLKDERILSREIGYTVEFPEARFGGDIRYFNDKVDRLIMLVLRQPVVTMTNDLAWDYANSSGSALVRGVELGAHWQPWSGASLQMSGSYSRIDSPLVADQQSVPRTTWSLLFRQALPQEVNVSAGYYRVSGMQWQSSADVLPAYDKLDLRLAKRFRWQNQSLEVALVARNLLGSYASYKTDVLARRISFMQVNWSF